MEAEGLEEGLRPQEAGEGGLGVHGYVEEDDFVVMILEGEEGRFGVLGGQGGGGGRAGGRAEGVK